MEVDSQNLHSKLIDHISGDLDPSLKDKWCRFIHSIIRHDLGDVTIERCNTFYKVADELMDESLIEVGRYDYLIAIFDNIGLVKLKKEVQTKQTEIQAVIEREREGTDEIDASGDTDDAVRNEDKSERLHFDLIKHLGRTLHPSRSSVWSKFIHSSLAVKLTRDEIAECESIGEVFGKLMTKKVIRVGDYKFVVDILRRIWFIKLSDEVKVYQKRICDALQREGNGATNCTMDERDSTGDEKTDSHSLEDALARHIGGELSPRLAERWTMFIHSYLSVYLSKAEVKECKYFADVFTKLKEKNLIKVGNYKFLTDVLRSIGLIKLQEEVKSRQRQIKDVWETERKGKVADEEIYSREFRSETIADVKWSIALHAKLIQHIGGDLQPSLPEWPKFTGGILSSQLQQAEIAECKGFADVFNKLMSKKLIEVGNYEFLWKILDSIELIKLRDEVRTYENKIKNELEKEMKADAAPSDQDMKERVNAGCNVIVKESTKLIAELVSHVAGDLHPSISSVWSRLTNSYISSNAFIGEDQMAKCTCFEDVFNKLMEKEFIAVGNYEFLIGLLSSIDLIKLKGEVKRLEKRIKEKVAMENEGKDPLSADIDSRAVKLPASLSLHFKMMNHIGGKVSPSLDNWSSFMMFIGRYLKPAEKAKCKCFADVFNKLMSQNVIELGEYGQLVQCFKDMNLMQLKHEVEEYQKDIKDALEQEKEMRLEKEKALGRESPITKKRKQNSHDQVDSAAAASNRQENPGTSGSASVDISQQQKEQDKLADQIEDCIVKGDVKFEDIVGLQEVKQAFHEAVILPLQRPDAFTDNLKPWTGILLFGPPGTGKSYLAKAAATKTKSTFFSISTADIVSKWVGESAKMIKALFKKAREKKPSIIFIDEVDSLSLSRKEHHSEAGRQVITQLLRELDGVGDGMEGVLFLGATNRPNDLDEAMLRRFQKRFYITLPDATARSEMFKLHIGCLHSLRDDEFVDLGEQSEGFSGADIYNVAQDAMMTGLNDAEKATHFEQISVQSRENPGTSDRFWTSCSSDSKGAIRKNFKDIPKNKFQRRKVTMKDIMEALRRRKPTVKKESLEMFQKFDEDYGEQTMVKKARVETEDTTEEAACN